MYLPGPGPLDRSTEAATAAAAAVGSAGRAALAVLEAVSPERPTPGRESWEARSTGRSVMSGIANNELWLGLVDAVVAIQHREDPDNEALVVTRVPVRSQMCAGAAAPPV